MQVTLSDRAERRPALFRISTDLVMFAVGADYLQVWLVPRDSRSSQVWALPGGCAGLSEPLDDCAGRVLRAHTGLHDVYLEQLYTFGRAGCEQEPREVSVAYYALVGRDRLAGMKSPGKGAWYPVGSLPDLYLDHREIVLAARERLAAKLGYSTIVFQLMPQYFTLGELQEVYEIVCARSVDKRNFRKRVLAMEHVVATGRIRRDGSHRPARLYRCTSRDAIHYLK